MSSSPSFLYHLTQARLFGYESKITVVSDRSAGGGQIWGDVNFTFPSEKDIDKKLLVSGYTHMVAVPNKEEEVAFVSDTNRKFYILRLSGAVDEKKQPYKFAGPKSILGKGTKIYFSPTGNAAAILNIYRIYVYDFSTSRVVKELNLNIKKDGYLQTMAFSEDGSRLVAVSRKVLSTGIRSKITVWKTEDFTASEKTIVTETVKKDSRLGIQGITFLPDSQKVLYVENMKDNISTACIWDTENGPVTTHYIVGTPSVMAASRDCTKVAIGYNNGSLCVFNTSNWEFLKRKTNVHENKVTAVSFSANGGYIVSGGSDKAIRFWDFNKAGDTPIGRVGVASAELVSVGMSDNQTKIWGLDTYGRAFMWTIKKKNYRA